jgi:hypothetical protein
MFQQAGRLVSVGLADLLFQPPMSPLANRYVLRLHNADGLELG